MNKYLVCYGENVVELHRNQLIKSEALEISKDLIQRGFRNVRIRLEDPNHPTWPMNFDLEEKAK